jgi:AsmA protein
MPRRRKVALLAAGGLIAALLLVAAAVLVTLGLNARSRVQSLAAEALGMQVDVGGRVSVGLWPRLHVTMKDVQVRNRGSVVASATQARIALELLPLLHRQVRLTGVSLDHASISIERQADGSFNFERRGQIQGSFTALDVASVSLADATLVYTDKRADRRFQAQPCRVELRDLKLASERGAAAWNSLAFSAQIACGELRTRAYRAADLKMSIAGGKGVFAAKPVTMRLFDGEGSATIDAVYSGAAPRYRVHYTLSNFRLAEFFKTMTPKKTGDGPMDFSADLTMRGETLDELTQSAAGKAAAHGHDLTLEIGDIDKRFSRFESSQNFNLVDVGAFFFAGPLGPVVTKGYDFANIFREGAGSSQVQLLNSEWDVERGVANARDVAMATTQNRLAMKGGLDFVNERFQDVTIALIDAQGCATVKQNVHGSFDQPQVEQPNILVSLTGPARKLFTRARKLLGGKCDVFYAGSVAPPR